MGQDFQQGIHIYYLHLLGPMLDRLFLDDLVAADWARDPVSSEGLLPRVVLVLWIPLPTGARDPPEPSATQPRTS